MGAARILILGAGVFGALAAEELRARGHVAACVSRASGVDVRDAASVGRALAGRDALLHAAGPFQEQRAGAARAAADAGVPYVDLSDDRAFSERVRAVDARTPLLTGMSTTPALAEALASRVGEGATCAMYVGGANRQGPATMAFAARSRLDGPPLDVDFPRLGRRRAYPARAFFDGPYYVAVGGVRGLGWRFRPLLRALAPVAARLPRLGRDTAGALVAMRGARREALVARERGQRLAVLPAVWAIERALAGEAPPRAALPREWVDAEALLAFVAASGVERVSA
ncbi:MAG TPA: hypothetical protein VFH78_03920 [Candidatus Thermoplasmatota archaeon]|nr:hypothetical protein [Candidatus Thermoplasmatota archaeon]